MCVCVRSAVDKREIFYHLQRIQIAPRSKNSVQSTASHRRVHSEKSNNLN